MSKIITLIGIKLAKKNRNFLFAGAVKECENCNSSLKSVCIENLEKDRVYKILEIRKVIHPCPVFEGGVTIIEVEKAPITIAIDIKTAYEGATISCNIPDCNETSCYNYSYCKPLGIKPADKFKILKILGNLPSTCSKEKRLKLVEVK